MNGGCPASPQILNRLVDPHVLARGRLPRVVNAHPVQLNPAPSLRARVPVESLANLVEKRLRFVGAELEACSAAGRGVELLHRVVESARRSYDGDCAVA